MRVNLRHKSLSATIQVVHFLTRISRFDIPDLYR